MENLIPSWKDCIDILDKCKKDYIDISKQLGNIRKNIRDSRSEIDSKEAELNDTMNPQRTPKEILNDAIKKSNSIQKEKSDNSCKENKRAKEEAKKQFEDKKIIILNSRKEKLNKLYADAEETIKTQKKFEEKLHQETTYKYNKVQEINQKLQKAQQETEQIELYKSKISSEYENISNNSNLLDDICSGRYIKKEIDEMIGSLNDAEVAKIAKNLANNQYVKSPKSSKIPIFDILFSIGDVAGDVLECIGGFISKIYTVGVSLISSFLGKFLYCGLITVLLLVGVFYLFYYGGKVVLGILGVFVGLIALLFVINLVISVIQKKLTVKNFKYYAVGYYYINNRNNLMRRVAGYLLNRLKSKSPESYQAFINSSVSGFQQNIQVAQSEYQNTLQEYNQVKQKNSLVIQSLNEEISNKEKIINRQCEEQLLEENQAYDKTINSLEETLKRELQKHETSKEEAIRIAKEEERNSKSIREAKIKRLKNEISILNEHVKELEKDEHVSEKKIDQILSESAETYGYITSGKAEITAIEEKKGFDVPVNDLFADIEQNPDFCVKIDGLERKIYSPVYFKSNQKPVIIKYSGFGGEDSIEASSAIYEVADNIFCHLVNSMCSKAFLFQIIDSTASNALSIISKMKTLSDDKEITDLFIENEMLKICTRHEISDEKTEFGNVVKSRTDELGNVTIIEKNKEYEKRDNMVRYVFITIRLCKNSSFLKNMNRMITACDDIGIIPILFISEESFADQNSAAEIKKAVKESCGNIYYTMRKNGKKILVKEEYLITY